MERKNRLTQEQVDEMIADHQHWLKQDCDGWDGMKADLSYANLAGADLSHADLAGCNGLPPIACPEEGSFVAFKKCFENKIVKLLIPEDAKRSSATTGKCRCDKAKVVSITSMDGETSYESAVSAYDTDFVYKAGETVYANSFNDNRWDECSNGIHFFITREEAVEY